MALHCPATLLVGTPEAVARVDEPGLVDGYGPYAGATVDIVAELQALADLHRGERVLVPVDEAGFGTVAERVGRGVRAPTGDVLRIDVGDDGWVLVSRSLG